VGASVVVNLKEKPKVTVAEAIEPATDIAGVAEAVVLGAAYRKEEATCQVVEAAYQQEEAECLVVGVVVVVITNLTHSVFIVPIGPPSGPSSTI